MDNLSQAKKGLREIAHALFSYAQICGIESMNVHVRQGDSHNYMSGFAVNGDELLFDFMELEGEKDDVE